MDVDQRTNAELFNESEPEKLYKFLHECADEVCGCQEALYQQYSNSESSEEQFNEFRIKILKLLRNPNSFYCNAEKMPLEFIELSKHIQEAIMICLKVRKNELTDALLYTCSTKYKPTLFNYDWSLKYIMGSSTMSSIREPLLQLNLICKEKKEDCTVKLELDASELDTLIKAMETVIR